MPESLLFSNRFYRYILYIFGWLGVGVGLAYVATFNVSEFEGGRGVAFVALLLPLLFLLACFFVYWELSLRRTLGSQKIKGLHLAVILFATPGVVFGVAPALFFYAKYEVAYAKKQSQDQLETAARKAASDQLLEKDWARGVWRNAIPMCLEFLEKGITSSCPGTVAMTYCWRMDPAKDWGLQHTDCSKGESSTVVAAPGFTAYQTRPWCRLYGPCSANAAVSCAVATSDLQVLKNKCERL
jgi:hypothetical protein